MKDTYSIQNTTSVNGIFIILVFASHLRSYITLSPFANNFLTYLGQLMVTTFFLFSGYGIFLSIEKKGMTYLNQFPRKRILSVLLSFDACVLIYQLLTVVLHKPYPISVRLLAFTGWTNVGNSNWYIFVILILYLITWISFKLSKQKPLSSLILTSILCYAFLIILSFVKENYWYNTLLCYPLGMWFAYLGSPILAALKKSNLHFAISLIGFLVAVIVLRYYRINTTIYTLMALCFCLLILIIMSKVCLYHPILYWLGKHLFPIYMLMRIPMSLMKNLINCQLPNGVFIIISLVCTLALAKLYETIVSCFKH